MIRQGKTALARAQAATPSLGDEIRRGLLGRIAELKPTEHPSLAESPNGIGALAEPMMMEGVDHDRAPRGARESHCARRRIWRHPRHVLERDRHPESRRLGAGPGQLVLRRGKLAQIRHHQHTWDSRRRRETEKFQAPIPPVRADAIHLEIMERDPRRARPSRKLNGIDQIRQPEPDTDRVESGSGCHIDQIEGRDIKHRARGENQSLSTHRPDTTTDVGETEEP